jgi:hypothetical protein
MATIPQQHQIEIAKRTLRAPDAMVAVLGGMDKAQARKVLSEAGYSDGQIATIALTRRDLRR